MKNQQYKDYRTTHVGPDSWAEEYDEVLFNPKSYDYIAWQKEKKILDIIIAKYAKQKMRYLDFACGTGRVLSYLENSFNESVGVDISKDMLVSSRNKVKKSTLVCGDVTRNSYLVPGTFDCITTFRFFLHAQPSLRDEAMEYLSRKLHDSNSIMIFNIHGNKFSTRWFVVVFDKLRGKQNNHMSIREVKKLTSKYDLEIIDYYGINYLDKSLYNFMPKILWNFCEYILRLFKFLKPFSVYIIYVCKKKSN